MELRTKVVRRWTGWVLFNRDNGLSYELHRLDGLTWKFFKEIYAGNDADAIERATDITTTADLKKTVLIPNCAEDTLRNKIR